MKKFLGVSLVAVLAVSPMMAQANVGKAETGDLTIGVASTKYVKEAYNAMADAVNAELGTINTAITNVNTTAGNAADKDLSNLSTTGKANVSAKGTYSASTNYDAGTVGAAIKGKQDTITDLATIRSGAAKGATSVQSVTAATTEMANGTISVDGTAVAVKGLGSAAYTASTAYATAAQGTKADNAADQNLSNLSATGKANVSAVGTYDSTATYTAGTVGAAIKAVNTTAGNAANKDLSNLSATGKANVSAVGTYDSTATYTAGTVGAAIKGKQDALKSSNSIIIDANTNAPSLNAVATNSGFTIGTSGVQVTAGTANIVDGAVTTTKIADLNVTTGKLADSAVTTVKINNGAVITDKLADNAVTTAKIKDSNVTTAKIADLNVTSGKLADSAVTTAKIADGNVTTAKIENGAVTAAKLGAEIQLYSGWNGGAAPTPHATTVALVDPAKAS